MTHSIHTYMYTHNRVCRHPFGRATTSKKIITTLNVITTSWHNLCACMTYNATYSITYVLICNMYLICTYILTFIMYKSSLQSLSIHISRKGSAEFLSFYSILKIINGWVYCNKLILKHEHKKLLLYTLFLYLAGFNKFWEKYPSYFKDWLLYKQFEIHVVNWSDYFWFAPHPPNYLAQQM